MVGVMGKVAAIRQRRRKAGHQRDPRDQPVGPQDARQAVQQADVVDVGRRFRAGARLPW